MAITRYDTPAQQQAMPYQAPEPIQAYAAALQSMQGRYDRAYLASKATQNALSAVQVRAVDAGSKQAYVDMFGSKLKEILDKHNGNYGDAANEIDSLASFVTSDGHLAGMNNAFTHAQEIQKNIEKDPTQLAFGLDALYKPYLNADGSAAGNLTAQVEKREDWLGGMDKILGKVKDSEMADIRAWAKDPAFYENVHSSGVSAQRIRGVVEKNIGNYIHNTNEGNQHYRAAAQDVLRRDLGVAYLNNATAAQRAYADKVAYKQVVNDFLNYGNAYQHGGTQLSLIHNPEYAQRQAKEAKETEYAGFTTVDTIPLVGPGMPSGSASGVPDAAAIGNLRGDATAASLPSGMMVAAGAEAGIDDTVAREKRAFTADNNPKMDKYLREMSREYGNQIWGGAHAKVAQGILAKGKFADLPQSLREDLANYVEKYGNKRSPMGNWKSLEVTTVSPDAVHLPGKDVGQASFNQAIFGQNTNNAAEIPNNLPLYDQQGNQITGADFKMQKGLIDKNGNRVKDVPTINANVSGIVSYNSGRRLATALDKASPYMLQLNLGGQTYYTPAPATQILHNSKSGTGVFSYGKLEGRERTFFQAGQQFDRVGRVNIDRQPVPNVPGLSASYKVESTGSQPEFGIDNSDVSITLHDQKTGKNIEFNKLSVPNFFDHIDKSRPDYGLPAETLQQLPAELLQKLPATTLVSDVVTFGLARQLAAQQAAKK